MIRYKVIPRKNPIDKSIKYYASTNDTQQVSFDQICEEVAHSSTATQADVKAVLNEIILYMQMHLLDGRSVNLGDLGSFHVTLKSQGETNKEDFTAANITNVMVRWTRPTKFRREFTPGIGSVRFKQDVEKKDEPKP